MNIFQAFILGIIQGITEFLPVSSSAHLIIFPYLMGWRFPADQNFVFGVIVQLGTLISLIIFFRNSLWEILKAVLTGVINRKPFESEQARLGWYVILATIPAGLAGILLKSKVEETFANPILTSIFLFGTALLLIIAEVIGKKSRVLSELNWKNALWIGLFQAISIFPGISRSGSCISGGMTQNLKRKDAAHFGFLMAIPIMLAAGLVSLLDLFKINLLSQFMPVVLIGTITAAVVGYLVIAWMLKFLNKYSLYPFSIYCFLLGLMVMSIHFLFPINSVFAADRNENEIVKVEMSSSLNWIIPEINQCNQIGPRYQLLFQNNAKDPTEKLTIRIGEVNGSEEKYFKIFEESVYLVINQSNPLIQIHALQVNDIYSGKISNWQNLKESCPDCFEKNNIDSVSKLPIQAWAFIPDSTSQKIIEDLFLNQVGKSPVVNIAPDEQAMAEAISLNPSAIGFLLGHWKNDQLKVIPILDLQQERQSTPVLVGINANKVNDYALLIHCIQSGLS